MSRHAAALLASALVLLPAIARAQGSADDLDTPAPVPTNLSTELIDASTYSRFHLVTRASFSDGHSVFTDSALWSFEARANIRVMEGLTLAATLPFGLGIPGEGEKKFFFGNFSVGVAGGGSIRLGGGSTEAPGARLRLALAADVYAPTAPKPAETDVFLFAAERSVAGMRAIEPWLYLADLMAFRARLQAGVSYRIVTATFELGLAPAFTLESSSDFLMWMSAAGRLSVLAHPAIEPFVEGGTAIQVVTPGAELSPALQITPGVRLHFGAFDPAIFASFNVKESAAILFGIDLAGAFVPARRTQGEQMDDFLGRFE